MKAGELNKQYLLNLLNRLFGAENVVSEYKFHPVRRWRFDYAIPDALLSVEYNGHGGFVKAGGMSRHGSIIGLTGDCEKINQAIVHGWRVIQFTALHFQHKDRIKHKLTDPETTIMQVIAQIQTEKENKQ